jgi:hypothetical protein
MSAYRSVAPPLRLKELHGCRLMRANDGRSCDDLGLRGIGEIILHGLILYLTQNEKQGKCLKQEPYDPFAIDARNLWEGSSRGSGALSMNVLVPMPVFIRVSGPPPPG